MDTCIDCGFCEYVCPSGGVGCLHGSASKRCAPSRACARTARTPWADKWEAAFRRIGVDLCAADGLCATRCPLGIDIAGFMKKLRGLGHSSFAKGMASSVARHFGLLEGAASGMLSFGSGAHKLLGHHLAEASGALTRAVTGMKVPDLNAVHLTGGAPAPRGSVTPGPRRLSITRLLVP